MRYSKFRQVRGVRTDATAASVVGSEPVCERRRMERRGTSTIPVAVCARSVERGVCVVSPGGYASAPMTTWSAGQCLDSHSLPTGRPVSFNSTAHVIAVTKYKWPPPVHCFECFPVDVSVYVYRCTYDNIYSRD